MSNLRDALQIVAIGVYWFLGFYFITLQADLAVPAGLLGTINGLLLYGRIQQLKNHEKPVFVDQWLALYLPPPILAIIGLILWLLLDV